MWNNNIIVFFTLTANNCSMIAHSPAKSQNDVTLH